MSIIKATNVNGETIFEFIECENRYEVNQMKYYIKYISKYRIFKGLYHGVENDYEILSKSISNGKQPQEIRDYFLDYINLLKKFEEKAKRNLKKFSDSQKINKIFKDAHSNKAYNLMYNMRNYEEHINCPIQTIQCDIEGEVEIKADISKMIDELDDTGWKKLLQNQFKGDTVVEIKHYIKQSFQVVKYVYQEIYKLILLEDEFLTRFCIKLHNFYNKYGEETEKYQLHLSDTNILEISDNLKIDLSNHIDIIFIKELLLAKKVNATNIECQIGQRIVYDDIEYICVSKSKDILNNKIKEQIFFPSCLSMKDINFILHNKEK